MKTGTMTVTQESVTKACADLTKLGVKPTVGAVRARIDGGSPNSIAPLVKIWNTNQPKVATQVQAGEQQLAHKDSFGVAK